MPTKTINTKLLDTMKWRCIGPPRGGRVIAVVGHPTKKMVFYFGASGGGVWKTEDGGTYWENISDGFFTSASIGAIEISQSDPNVIYVGTGEACIRGNLCQGDGVYKTTDGGRTWENIGLKDTQHISRIRIDPNDHNILYVSALGHAFGPNKERGIFKSVDGGNNWKKVLYKSPDTGGIDLSINPKNSRIIFAAMWQAKREPWTFTSGGPESGIWKSVDRGETWIDITKNNGLPKGINGRIGIAYSPAKDGRIWAIIENKKSGGLYRSDDYGDNWELISEDKNLIQRPWYYCHVFADPKNADTVYVLNLRMLKSIDGGKTFEPVSTPHGDNHDLWIDPNDTNRMIEGNDGGACVSFNGGSTWSTIYNQLTSQFYHLTTDNQFPYRVYATQQDNSAISVPSRTNGGAITWKDCYSVGTSESGHIAVDPNDHNIVYSGAIGSSPGGGDSLLRYDHSADETRIVSVWPEFSWGFGPVDLKFRFQWTYPIVFSKYNNKKLFVAGNVLFESTNEGQSWKQISPDLTRNDPSKLQASGGPITLDTTMVEHYCTIFSFAESNHDENTLWTGSDDGLIHVSTDGSKNWRNVTPQELPDWARIDIIETSRHNANKAYISSTMYKFGDNQPYLFRTKNNGKSWTRIDSGIGRNDYTRVIREDPEIPGLLYAGTESGVYFSSDDGENWNPLKLNLPTVSITDMAVKEDELIVSTNGRSFWILENLNLIRQLSSKNPSAENMLFKPTDKYRVSISPLNKKSVGAPGKVYMLSLGSQATFYNDKDELGNPYLRMIDSGQNPEPGIVINYFLNSKSTSEVKISFSNDKNKIIKTFSSNTDEKNDNEEIKPTKNPGMNKFIWNMRYPDAKKIDGIGSSSNNGVTGPVAAPGKYLVNLEVDGKLMSQEFEIKIDPRSKSTASELKKQHSFLMEIRDQLSKCHETIQKSYSVKKQIGEWNNKFTKSKQFKILSESTLTKLTTQENILINPDLHPEGELDRINLESRLCNKLAELVSVPSFGNYQPTDQSYDVFSGLVEKTDVVIKEINSIIEEDLPLLENQIHELSIPMIEHEQ
tara:strand:+ start:1025 stop:4195 length:3171 start_codon:yes stop_codon:yes gene_type:complete